MNTSNGGEDSTGLRVIRWLLFVVLGIAILMILVLAYLLEPAIPH